MKIYNEDGLVNHRGPRQIAEPQEEPEQKDPVTLLEQAIARDDVRRAVAAAMLLPLDASIGEVVKTAIDRDEVLDKVFLAQAIADDRWNQAPAVAFPAFVASCAAFVLWAGGMPHVATDAQGRAFRRDMHIAAAADQDETSPIRLKPTATELRHREAVRRWWA